MLTLVIVSTWKVALVGFSLFGWTAYTDYVSITCPSEYTKTGDIFKYCYLPKGAKEWKLKGKL